MAAVDVGIVITQFGKHELTVNCLQTLQAHHDLEAVRILVVDDASHGADSRRELLQLDIPFEVLAFTQQWWDHNSLERSGECFDETPRTSFTHFLNNDVVTEGNWIPQLITPLHSESTRCTGVRWREEQGVPIHELSLPTTQFIEGWCMAVDSDTFSRLGGFDQKMQLYFSDTDFQCRLLLQFSTVENGPLAVVENLPIQHLEHQTTKSASNRNSLWQQDRKIFIHKWRRIPFI